MRGRSVCPWKDSSISPSTRVTSSSTSWTKFAQTCPGGSVHSVQLNPRSAHACCICDGSMVFSFQNYRCTLYTLSLSSNLWGSCLRTAYQILQGCGPPSANSGHSSLLTYGTPNSRIGPSLIFLVRYHNVLSAAASAVLAQLEESYEA